MKSLFHDKYICKLKNSYLSLGEWDKLDIEQGFPQSYLYEKIHWEKKKCAD